jgi:hypothetical protein
MLPTLLLGCALTLGAGALGVYLVETHRLTALGYVLICVSPFVLCCTTVFFGRSFGRTLLFVAAPLPYFIALLIWPWYLQPVGQFVLADRGAPVTLTVGKTLEFADTYEGLYGCYTQEADRHTVAVHKCWALTADRQDLPLPDEIDIHERDTHSGETITEVVDPQGVVAMRRAQAVSIRTAWIEIAALGGGVVALYLFAAWSVRRDPADRPLEEPRDQASRQ